MSDTRFTDNRASSQLVHPDGGQNIRNTSQYTNAAQFSTQTTTSVINEYISCAIISVGIFQPHLIRLHHTCHLLSDFEAVLLPPPPAENREILSF